VKKALVLIIPLLSCSLPPRPIGVPPTFTYAAIAGKKIAYGTPAVLSSEIFYENRFTDQSYHSMDPERTQEAFFRDFKQKVGKTRLPWRRLTESTDSLVRLQLTAVNKPLDSLPSAVIRLLGNDDFDVVVLVYAVRLYHQQSIGLRPDKTGSVNSYSSIISKSLDYICSIIDVRTNRSVFHVAMKRTAGDNSLDFMELAIDDLFRTVLRR
jgi:hypothetical protein